MHIGISFCQSQGKKWSLQQSLVKTSLGNHQKSEDFHNSHQLKLAEGGWGSHKDSYRKAAHKDMKVSWGVAYLGLHPH